MMLGLVVVSLLSVTRVEQAEAEQTREMARLVAGPVSVTAVEGGVARLRCGVAGLGAGRRVQWTRDDFGLGTDRALPGYDRYRMAGEDPGTWDLEITGLRLEDEGVYQCQVLAAAAAPPLRSAYATLTVLAPPQPPVLTSGPRLAAREGGTAMVQCIR